MWCIVGNSSIFFPPTAPPPASPTDGIDGGWVVVGVVLCEVAIGLLTLGTTVQRYGLSVVAERGCCGRRAKLGCFSLSTLVWLGGWGIYISGNGIFFIAVSLAPATLCSALLATVVIFNAFISRALLGERLALCDLQGGLAIGLGIGVTQACGYPPREPSQPRPSPTAPIRLT